MLLGFCVCVSLFSSSSSHFIHSATINLQLSFHFHWKLFRDWVWYDCYDCARVVYMLFLSLLFSFYARLLYGNINCILFVFFPTIVLNVASHRAASKWYSMTSKEIDWNQIVKAVVLLMLEWVWVCVWNWECWSFLSIGASPHTKKTATGIQSIQTIGNRAQKLKTHHIHSHCKIVNQIPFYDHIPVTQHNILDHTHSSIRRVLCFYYGIVSVDSGFARLSNENLWIWPLNARSDLFHWQSYIYIRILSYNIKTYLYIEPNKWKAFSQINQVAIKKYAIKKKRNKN